MMAQGLPALGAIPGSLGEIRGGMVIPVQDDQGRIRTLFTAAEMRPMADGTLRCRNFRLTNREPALVVEAPECLLSPVSYEVRSSGPIQMRSSEEGFELSGEGFAWIQQAGRLVISNRVQAKFRGLSQTAMLPGSSAAAAPTVSKERVTEIASRRFEFELRRGRVSYLEDVRLTEPGMQLSCGELRGEIDLTNRRLQQVEAVQSVRIVLDQGARKVDAIGPRAVYVPATAGGRLELPEGCDWTVEALAGRADSVVLTFAGDRTRLRAEGKAELELPSSLVSRWVPGAAVGSPVISEAAAGPRAKITASAYEYADDRLTFSAPVEVSEDRGHWLSGPLEVYLQGASNVVTRLEATGGVELQAREPGREFAASAQAVSLDLTQEPSLLELKGASQWAAGEFKGGGDTARLTFAGASVEAEVEGGAWLELARTDRGREAWMVLGGARGTATAPSNAPPQGPIRLTSSAYAVRREFAEFRGGVVADLHPGTFECERLRLAFAPEGALEEVVGEGGVKYSDLGRELTCEVLTAQVVQGRLSTSRGAGQVRLLIRSAGQDATATAEEILYRAADDLVELVGRPRVRTSDGVLVEGARAVQWVLSSNRLRVTGPYAVTGPQNLLREVSKSLPAIPPDLRP